MQYAHPKNNVEAENQILDDDADFRSFMPVSRHRFHGKQCEDSLT